VRRLPRIAALLLLAALLVASTVAVGQPLANQAKLKPDGRLRAAARVSGNLRQLQARQEAQGHSGTPTRKAPRQIQVGVLVFTTFGSFDPPSGETGPWAVNEDLPYSFTVTGLPQPIRCGNPEGPKHLSLCVAQTETTKENSGPSAALVLTSPWLDTTDKKKPVPVQHDLRPASKGGPTRIFIDGIAGTPFEVGTLGGVCISKALVDGDLGAGIEPSPTHPHGWDPLYDYGEIAFTEYSPKLVQLAYDLTKNLPLEDLDDAGVAFRAMYPGEANDTPKVITGVDAGLDNFFVGDWASDRVDEQVKARSGGKYDTHCASDLEDTPINHAARRLGYSPEEGDLLPIRSASDLEEEPLLPEPWSTDRMIAFLQTDEGFPGFTPAVNNAYKVTAKVAHYLLAHPTAVA
jgi:purine nucleoside permease